MAKLADPAVPRLAPSASMTFSTSDRLAVGVSLTLA
jgi:hypothetical protein